MNEPDSPSTPPAAEPDATASGTRPIAWNYPAGNVPADPHADDAPLPQSIVVAVDPDAVVKKLGESRVDRLRAVHLKKSQGKFFPKPVFRPGPAVVAAPEWASGVGSLQGAGEEGFESPVKRTSPTDDTFTLGNIKHGADLESPLFQDRRNDQHMKTDISAWWYLLTEEGRLMAREHLARRLDTYRRILKAYFMAVFWMAAKEDAELSYAPRSTRRHYARFVVPDGKSQLNGAVYAFPGVHASVYIAYLPRFLQRWWRLGLELRRRVQEMRRVIQHPHVGSWRRLLSMMWRRRYPQTPTLKVLPKAWDPLKVARPDGQPGDAYLGAPLPDKVTIHGVSFQQLLDAALTTGVSPAAVAGRWFYLRNMPEWLPTPESIKKMRSALNEPAFRWEDRLAAYNVKMIEAFMAGAPANFFSTQDLPADAIEGFEALRLRFHELECVQRESDNLYNFLSNAEFSEASKPGAWSTTSDAPPVPLKPGDSYYYDTRFGNDFRYDHETKPPTFNDSRANGLVDTFGRLTRVKEPEILAGLERMRALKVPEKVLQKALQEYQAKAKK